MCVFCILWAIRWSHWKDESWAKEKELKGKVTIYKGGDKSQIRYEADSYKAGG